MGVILMLLVILGSLGHSATSIAGTTVALRESYAGNLSFELTGGSFRTNHNNSNACSIATSSSQSFNTLPLAATVVKAYLYWAGSGTSNDNQVTLNGNTVTSDRLYTETWDTNRYFYNGVADVTSLVSTYRNTTYTVSGLTIDTSNTYCDRATVLGGWALMVIYEEDSEDFRVINVYEGFQSFQHESFTLIPNNFELPTNPSGKHAHITWEGDDTLGTDGEYLTFEGNLLTDSSTQNAPDNQFDSYSNVQGGLTTYGVDIDEYDISAYLNAGDTSVTTTYSAGQDLVFLSAEIISVSNIPVADLAVSTSDPDSWLEGSTVTQNFVVTNNGPNDIPINSVEFNTTLPSELTFNGSQGGSDWSCTQTGQNLSCIYKPKLRSGWSDYLDLTFDVANVAEIDITVLASVNHNNAPYDIFDNQVSNDIDSFEVTISSSASVDLSASSKTYTDVSGDLLLADDTLRYTITIDDVNNLTVNGITVIDDLPANISLTPNAYTIISSPVTETFTAGTGVNGTGTLTFTGINLAPGTTEQIIFEVKVDTGAQESDSLRNIANISDGSSNWQVDTGDITVTVIKPDLSPSTIEALDKNGGFLESGDVITVLITLDDLYDTDISTLQATLDIPALIDSFSVINSHTGTEIPNSYIDIQNISFSNSETPVLEFEFVMEPAAVDGDTFDFSTELTIGADVWTLVAPTLTVTNPLPAAYGNKALYLSGSLLSRVPPSSDTIRNFRHGETLDWVIDHNLQADLELTAGDMGFDFVITGYRTGGVKTRFDIDLIYNDNISSGDIVIANTLTAYGNYRINTQYPLAFNLNLAGDLTIPKGSTFKLRIYNQSHNNNNNSYSQIDVNNINPDPNDDTYSKVTLNAATVINIDSISVWDATYGDPTGSGDGNLLTASQSDTNLFVRAVISDPFGAFDITGAEINITKANGTSYDFSPDSNSMVQVDDTSDDYTSSIKTYEKQITLLETGESIGSWTISIEGFEGLETGNDQVTHKAISLFNIIPFQPNINLSKSITVLNDPINGDEKPKAIPGAELKYSIITKNTGRGYADDGSIVLRDEIPDDADFYIGNVICVNGEGTGLGPICYQDGINENESGLTYNFKGIDDLTDHVQFSEGGSDFTYLPVDDGDGYDSKIRFIRISPAGNLNASDKAVSFEPQFTFEYQIRLN